MARPREPIHSKEQVWARNRREDPKPTCSYPGCSAKGDWHHKNGEALDNRPSNRVALCRSHHTATGNKAGHNR